MEFTAKFQILSLDKIVILDFFLPNLPVVESSQFRTNTQVLICATVTKFKAGFQQLTLF
jgi:hypothetical protein